MSGDKNKSTSFKRDDKADEGGSEAEKGRHLGTHTETVGDVTSALPEGDAKRPEAKHADEAIAKATADKDGKTITTDPFPGHEGRADGSSPPKHARDDKHVEPLGARKARPIHEVLRHARKTLLALGAAGTHAGLIEDINATLGDTDDGTAPPPPLMSDAGLKALEEHAKIDPTAAARLAMEKNNRKAQGGDAEARA